MYVIVMPQIIVINFGSQVAHLISRRIREMGVYAELVPSGVPLSDIQKLRPLGIILSGGPSSVNEQGAPVCDTGILSMGIPILGICYGHQLLARFVGGKVSNSDVKEFGKKSLTKHGKSLLLRPLAAREQIWMSHGDSVISLPKGFVVTGNTDTCPIAAFENPERGLYAVQFHPEVSHTPKGNGLLRAFVFDICKAKRDWDVKNLSQKLMREIQEKVKDAHVLMGISGGVDSTVAAILIRRAIGKQLHCIFVDHGLLRKNEAKEVEQSYRHLGLDIHYVDASGTFLRKLEGVTDPEKKRKIIGHTFIGVFEKKARELEKKHPAITFLAQGTIYPDRIESAAPSNAAAKIKSHHNLTLPEKMKLEVIEPLRDLYKDSVRSVGRELGIDEKLILRHPFPGPGLAVRILGAITPDRVKILQEADHIFISELKKSGYYEKTWQAFAALLPVKAVGAMGDARTYEYIISLRAVTSIDAMTADWAKLPQEFLEAVSNRIINEVKGVNRVVYDITQKPPGTIEYE